MRRALLVLTVLISLLIVAAPAHAVTSLTIHPQGAYDSPTTAHLTGTATCEGGTGTITFTNPFTPTPVVTGSVAVVCDGQPHTWAATITGGPFSVGQTILIRGTLTSPGGSTSYVQKVTLQ